MKQVRLHSIHKKNLFIIDKGFNTDIDVTDRTIKIGDAFGLGIDESKKFDIFKDFNIGINDNDVVYITGDSGSGKSVLLKELTNKFKDLYFKENKTEYTIADLNNIRIKEDEILSEGIGSSVEDAIKILASVGLNDAFLFLRKYKHLSDGQKYRYKLAKLIHYNNKVWIADEFCSTLDRDTAKIVSYNFQKIARKLNKILIVATTHNDLIYDLNPSVLVDNGFGEKCEIIYNDEVEKRKCSLYEEANIEVGTIEDYYKLSNFHYRDSSICFYHDIFRMKLKDKLIGVIVYTSPKPELHSRNIVFNKEYSRNFDRINKEIKCISRVIIHPKYRTIGLGHKLVSETLKQANCKVVELLSVMTKYNPFAIQAGMIKHKDKDYCIIDEYKSSMNLLKSYGFNIDKLTSIRENMKTLNTLSDEDFNEIKEKIQLGQRTKYNRGFGKGTGYTARFLKDNNNILNFDKEKFADFLKRWKPYEVDYYYWINDEWKEDESQKCLLVDEISLKKQSSFEVEEEHEKISCNKIEK